MIQVFPENIGKILGTIEEMSVFRRILLKLLLNYGLTVTLTVLTVTLTALTVTLTVLTVTLTVLTVTLTVKHNHSLPLLDLFEEKSHTFTGHSPLFEPRSGLL